MSFLIIMNHDERCLVPLPEERRWFYGQCEHMLCKRCGKQGIYIWLATQYSEKIGAIGSIRCPITKNTFSWLPNHILLFYHHLFLNYVVFVCVVSHNFLSFQKIVIACQKVEECEFLSETSRRNLCSEINVFCWLDLLHVLWSFQTAYQWQYPSIALCMCNRSSNIFTVFLVYAWKIKKRNMPETPEIQTLQILSIILFILPFLRSHYFHQANKNLNNKFCDVCAHKENEIGLDISYQAYKIWWYCK